MPDSNGSQTRQNDKDPKSPMTESFNFKPGKIIANKYEIENLLGCGWEGEVYLTRELRTGIERTAKFFFPKRNINNEVAQRFAQKLYRIRTNPLIIQYHNHEIIKYKSQDITCLISDYVDGDLLCDYLNKNPGKRIHPFVALKIIHTIALGLEDIHASGEYHGDLHINNIFVKPIGVGFHVKLIDPFDWRDNKYLNIKKDVVDLIRILYDILGGKKWYAKQGPEIKSICCGLKKTMITKKFKNAGVLRKYIETIEWVI